MLKQHDSWKNELSNQFFFTRVQVQHTQNILLHYGEDWTLCLHVIALLQISDSTWMNFGESIKKEKEK
jgi:hypothetical protein